MIILAPRFIVVQLNRNYVRGLWWCVLFCLHARPRWRIQTLPIERRWRAQRVAETGVMVGRLRTALGKTSFPETSASHRAIPRDLVQLVEMLSGGRSPLTIGVISSGSLDGESLLGSRI